MGYEPDVSPLIWSIFSADFKTGPLILIVLTAIFFFTEVPFEWTVDNLESLRLCRNRAYHKVNSKRRQHLPASISSYLLKEWQSMRPDAPKMDGKQLLSAYNENFEQVSDN